MKRDPEDWKVAHIKDLEEQLTERRDRVDDLDKENKALRRRFLMSTIDDINEAGWGVYSATQFDGGRQWAVVIRPFDPTVQLIGRGKGRFLLDAIAEAWDNQETGTTNVSYSIEEKPVKVKLDAVIAALRSDNPTGAKMRRR